MLVGKSGSQEISEQNTPRRAKALHLLMTLWLYTQQWFFTWLLSQ